MYQHKNFTQHNILYMCCNKNVIKVVPPPQKRHSTKSLGAANDGPGYDVSPPTNLPYCQAQCLWGIRNHCVQ